MDILGQCVGVRLKYRGGEQDKHAMIQLLIEDDGNWYEKDFSISSYWIDDFIEVLQTTKARLEQLKPDPDSYGWDLE